MIFEDYTSDGVDCRTTMVPTNYMRMEIVGKFGNGGFALTIQVNGDETSKDNYVVPKQDRTHWLVG